MSLNTDLVNSILSFLTAILQSDTLKLIIARTADYWHSARFQGSYTVDFHHATLELKDKRGQRAIYAKRQRVKFIQNQVVAIQDQAWGDGNIFADYQCTPGIVADVYKEGYRYKILISLRATRNKGDHEDLVIERTITDGFTTPTGHFRTQIDHPTQHLSLRLIFPEARLPRQVTLIEQNTQHSVLLDQTHRHPLLDGRIEYHWQTSKPRLFEGYILRWEW